MRDGVAGWIMINGLRGGRQGGSLAPIRAGVVGWATACWSERAGCHMWRGLRPRASKRADRHGGGGVGHAPERGAAGGRGTFGGGFWRLQSLSDPLRCGLRPWGVLRVACCVLLELLWSWLLGAVLRVPLPVHGVSRMAQVGLRVVLEWLGG